MSATWHEAARVTETGRTRILIKCPHCEHDTWAYLWSFAGHGRKRCQCGAWLHRDGTVSTES